jgi:hypothetical protein
MHANVHHFYIYRKFYMNKSFSAMAGSLLTLARYGYRASVMSRIGAERGREMVVDGGGV